MIDGTYAMERNLYILVGFSFSNMKTLLSFQPHLLTVFKSLNCVFQCYLPREFATPSVLKDVFSTIHSKLLRSYYNFQLVYPDIQHYYHVKNVVICV
jgi:hypothetical protein